jgi:hypothetical protein
MDYPQLPLTSPPSSMPPIPGADAAINLLFNPPPAGPAPPVPHDPYQDRAKMQQAFKDAYTRCFDRREIFEAIWWRILLYVLGRHWIYYDRRAGRWLDKRLQKWIPKPVTNKIAETVSAILSVFGGVELAAAARPEGADPKDIQAAETATKYEPAIKAEHDMEENELESDFWLASLGNVFWFPWWDTSGGGAARFVPFEQCMACQTVSSPSEIKAAGDLCPTCGQPGFEPALDPQTGEPIGARVSQGRGRTDIVSPFEIAIPPVYVRADDSPEAIRIRWRPRTYCEDHYPEDVLKGMVWEHNSDEHTLQLYRALANATDIGSMPNGGVGGGESPTEVEGITEYELWQKPSKKYPKGLVLRAFGAGEDAKILELPDEGLPGPLPLQTPQGEYVWPWIHIGYERFGGRLWHRSPLEHLIEKNNQINQIDSLIQLMIQRTSNPVWLEPKGAEVKKFSGEPGVVLKYNPLVAGGNAKPERIEGASIPASLVRIREMLLADIENLAGTYDIIKGQKPTGVEAFSALQLLVERSQSRYGPVLKNRGKGYRRWFQVALEMERKWGPVERAQSVMGPNGAYMMQHFAKADLMGSVKIEVEDGSQMPKTSLGKRAAIEQLRQFGVINVQNPETAYRIMQVFGQTDLWPGLDAHIQMAQREQDQFEKWAMSVQFIPQPPQPMMGPAGAMVVDPMTGQPQMQDVPPQPDSPPPGEIKVWHDNEVHAAEHRKWANGDTVQRLLAEKPEIDPFLTWFIQQHDMAIQQAAMEQAMMQAGPGAGRDGKGVGGGRAMANSIQESGKPGVVGQPGQQPV